MSSLLSPTLVLGISCLEAVRITLLASFPVMWGKRILVCHPQVWFDLWFLTDAFYQIKNLVIFLLKLPSNISLTSRSCVLSNAFPTFTKKTKYFFPALSCYMERCLTKPKPEASTVLKIKPMPAHRLIVTPAHRLSVMPARKLSVPPTIDFHPICLRMFN